MESFAYASVYVDAAYVAHFTALVCFVFFLACACVSSVSHS